MVLESLFDWIFYPFLKLGNGLAVISISFIITAVTTMLYKFFTNQEKMKELKEELKSLQKQMKELKEEPQKFMETQKKAMQKNFEYMKHSIKPTIITMVPLLLIFGWLRGRFGELGDVITWGFSIPLFGTGLGWLGAYLISAIVFSMLLRKLLRIY